MERYDPTRQQEDFRRFDDTAPAGVREFYRLNHTYQTREFVRDKKRHYTARTRGEMGIWEAMEYLNTLVDESDTDTDLTQIEHNLQTAEASCKDGHPRWTVLAGLIHDLVRTCASTVSHNGQYWRHIPCGLRVFGQNRLSGVLRG